MRPEQIAAEQRLFAAGRPDLADLTLRLLAAGGVRVVGDHGRLSVELEPLFVSRLLDHGVLRDGRGAKRRKGGMYPSQCHDNSRELAERFRSYQHWTGLALSQDQAWRIHSWVVTPFQIIETTEPRRLYFGLPASEDPSFAD